MEQRADDALQSAKDIHAAWIQHVNAVKLALELITNICSVDADDEADGEAVSAVAAAAHAAVVEAGIIPHVNLNPRCVTMRFRRYVGPCFPRCLSWFGP
jgi:hypothetical protein